MSRHDYYPGLYAVTPDNLQGPCFDRAAALEDALESALAQVSLQVQQDENEAAPRAEQQ